MKKCKSITVENVSISLWKKFKIEAMKRDVTLSIAISEAMLGWLKPKEKTE